VLTPRSPLATQVRPRLEEDRDVRRLEDGHPNQESRAEILLEGASSRRPPPLRNRFRRAGARGVPLLADVRRANACSGEDRFRSARAPIFSTGVNFRLPALGDYV
jgi:hypothetical protein